MSPLPPVFDVDSHVTEPPDLWLSRVAGAWRRDVPHVARHPELGGSFWRIRDTWLTPVGYYAKAGAKVAPPDSPKDFDELDPAVWRPADRLEKMTSYGIHAQALHPNILGHEIGMLLRIDRDLALACIVAYNDFLSEFAAINRERLLPIAMIPFWNPPRAAAEMRRCKLAGHRGIVMGPSYRAFGLPDLDHPYWYPIYAEAQELGLPINVHSGLFRFFSGEGARHRSQDFSLDKSRLASDYTLGHMQNLALLSRLLTSELFDRFPRLKLVSIESGMGYINYLLESLDWNWRVLNVQKTRLLLPSEYFRRNCFATFWYETQTLRLLETYPDNFMFQTDFPHSNGQSPGHETPGRVPSLYLARTMADLPVDVVDKVLHRNAKALYATH